MCHWQTTSLPLDQKLLFDWLFVCQWHIFGHWQTKSLSALANWCHWQTKCLSLDQKSLFDRLFVCQWHTFGFIDRFFFCQWHIFACIDSQKVSLQLKDERGWLKISIADRLFVCQWLQKTKKTQKKCKNHWLTDFLSVSYSTFLGFLHTLTDKKSVNQWLLASVTDFLSVSNRQKA